MDDSQCCTVPIAPLLEGKEIVIDQLLPKTFLNELATSAHLSGKACVAGDLLLIQLHIETSLSLPCVVCNADAEKGVATSFLIESQEITESKTFFDFTENVRDAILLEVPLSFECGGKCPQREEIQRFLKKNPSQGNFPFEKLEDF